MNYYYEYQYLSDQSIIEIFVFHSVEKHNRYDLQKLQFMKQIYGKKIINDIAYMSPENHENWIHWFWKLSTVFIG